MREAKFSIGQVVRHRHFPFRGVVFDVDPEFSNTEEWLDAIPEPVRPDRDQPFLPAAKIGPCTTSPTCPSRT
ncbi:MAG: heat shock protein HspQ [Hyphomonadaceae bacterium]